MRILKSPTDFFDLLDDIGNNKFIAIGYVTGANLDVPKIKRKNPLTNRVKGYDDYSMFNDEGKDEIGALVKLTSYNFRYSNRKSVSKNYGKYKDDVNAIRQEFGLDSMKDKESYKQANNYGKNGVENYKGDNEALFGHTYNPQNIYGAKRKSIIYAVNKEGRIVKELSDSQIMPYLKVKNQEPSGVRALREMNVEEERIKEFIQKIKDLKFKYINFESDSVLYMAATVDGEKIAYINSNLKRTVNDINIYPEDFLKIARERYEIDTQDIQESYNRLIDRRIVRENRNYNAKNKLKTYINECVRRVIMENIYDQQWEKEIKAFIEAVENGEALIDGGYVAVEYETNYNDPRFIYYKEGEDHLVDDHFSVQNSRRLYWDEISRIRDLCKTIYGVKIYIPDDEYYDEVEGWEEESEW